MLLNERTDELKRELLNLLKDYNRETDLTVIDLKATPLYEFGKHAPTGYAIELEIKLKTNR